MGEMKKKRARGRPIYFLAPATQAKLRKHGRILSQQCNGSVNFSSAYYSPKLLASSPSSLQIMSVLFLCKLISLNIWVAKFKTSIVLCFCAYSHVNVMRRST